MWCRSGVFGHPTLDITRRGTPFRVGQKQVLIVAATFSAAGWMVLAGLEVLNPSKARRRFAWAGVVVLLASFAPVVLEHAPEVMTRVVLAGMHLAVGVPIIALLPLIHGGRPRPPGRRRVSQRMPHVG